MSIIIFELPSWISGKFLRGNIGVYLERPPEWRRRPQIWHFDGSKMMIVSVVSHHFGWASHQTKSSGIAARLPPMTVRPQYGSDFSARSSALLSPMVIVRLHIIVSLHISRHEEMMLSPHICKASMQLYCHFIWYGISVKPQCTVTSLFPWRRHTR